MGLSRSICAQVALTREAGDAAAILVSALPALMAECSAGPATLREQPACTGQAGSSCQAREGVRAGEKALKSRVHARQKAHAELVHSCFMHKLMGTHQISKGKNEPLPTSTFAAVADGAEADDGALGSQDGQRKALSVKGQVKILIEEATSLDNLAQMYEGWSAWI